ncbi:MAG: adenosine deaminase [Leptothrix sp. (in: Bacteria)]|nr:adenosine deaminase [Leptothrix sp. (in: b-proteobacteria)]
MKKLAFYAAMGSVVLMTGCASILNDQTQPVNVSASNGKAVQGSIDGVPFTGPGVVPLQRAKSSKVVTSTTAGCAKETAVESTVDPKFFINILTGGAFGSTTDYSTERMWKYADNVVIACGQ